MKESKVLLPLSGVFVRSPYNYDRNAASDESGINCQVDVVTGEATPTLTKQSFLEEVDINTIVRRFNLTGQLPVGVRMPTYADFENVPTYQEAMNAIAEANQSFMMMPAEVRARFGNDAAAFVEFCSDERNREEAEKLGLVPPPPTPHCQTSCGREGGYPPGAPERPSRARREVVSPASRAGKPLGALKPPSGGFFCTIRY